MGQSTMLDTFSDFWYFYCIIFRAFRRGYI